MTRRVRPELLQSLHFGYLAFWQHRSAVEFLLLRRECLGLQDPLLFSRFVGDPRLLNRSQRIGNLQPHLLFTSTSQMLIQLQRDFAAAQSAEASALSNYMKAKATLGRAVGSLLADHDVQLPEATDGQVSRASLPPASIRETNYEGNREQ